MRYGSVCSGIEAATAAWHHMGWEAAFFSEIEKFPCAVLEHHYPDVPLHGDFTTIEQNQYGKIDLLVGGTPCQSFSIAGLRGGLDDQRGNLALEFCRLAQREQPRWIVWENVPGVLSSNGGRDFGSILGALENIGYGLAYRVLDAQYFGVAQRRRRVFVVGYLGDWRPAAAVLFERHSMSGHLAPSREARKEVAGEAATGAGGSGGDGGARSAVDTFECGGIGSYSTSDNSSPLLRTGADLRPGCEALVASTFSDDGTARTLTARYDSSPCVDRGPDVVGTLTRASSAGGTITQQDVSAGHIIVTDVPDVVGTLRTKRPGEGGVQGDFDHIVPTVSPALNTQSGSHHAPDTKAYVATYPIISDADRADSMAKTPSPDAEGRVRLRNPGLGIGDDGDPMYTLQATKPHAIAFDTTQISSPHNFSNPQPGDPCHPLAAGAHPPAIAFQSNESHPSGTNVDVSPTLRVGSGGTSGNAPAVTYSIMPMNSGKDYKARETEVAQPIMAGGPVGGNQGGDFVTQQVNVPEIAGTMKACAGTSGGWSNSADHAAAGYMVPAASAVRRLTPVECERLQGFPDNFTAIPWRKKGAEDCPDGPRYKALGNSMAVPVMRWIGERINIVDDLISVL